MKHRVACVSMATLLTLSLAMNPVQATYQESAMEGPNVGFVSITTKPPIVHVGDPFRIKAVIVNKGPEPIYFSGVCRSPIYAGFSSNVEVVTGSTCDEYKEEALNPNQTVIVEGINGQFLTAKEAGDVRANVTFAYGVRNGSDTNPYRVTREFAFVVYDEKSCTLNAICVTTPELHDISKNLALEIVPGNHYQIGSVISYREPESLEFFYALQVNDENGVTKSLSWVKGVLQPYQEISVDASWIPDRVGHYTVKTIFWSPFEYTELIDPPPGTIWIQTDVDVQIPCENQDRLEYCVID